MPMTPTIDDVVQKRLPTWKVLDFSKRDHRHRGFFLRRRVQAVLAAPNTAWMLDEPFQATLVHRVEDEYAQVEAVVRAMVTSPDPADPSLPRHLDPLVYATPRQSVNLSSVGYWEHQHRHRRRHVISAIAWRAAAIHTELWSATSDQASSTLYVNALRELIDRRLRIVERLQYQLCDERVMSHGSRWTFSGGGANGPWLDGFVVRAIEPMQIPEIVAPQVAEFVGGDPAIAPAFSPRFPLSTAAWRWTPNNRTLEYNLDMYLSPHVLDSWLPDDKHELIQEFVSPTEHPELPNLTDVLDTMLLGQDNWWDRSWLPAGHAMCVLHLEAWLFARRRRLGVAAANTEIDGIANTNPRGYVAIGDLFSFTMEEKDRLMVGKTSDWSFESNIVSITDLQIGDHFAIMGSRFRNVITDPEEEWFNAAVADIDSDPQDEGAELPSIVLQRPGSPRLGYADFLELMGQELNDTLDAMRQYAALHPTATSLDWLNVKDFLVQWTPYSVDRFTDPQAWWIRLDLSALQVSDVDAAIQAVPRVVADDPDHGTGYTPPPVVGPGGSVYFPLYVPDMDDGWYGYLIKRRTDPNFPTPMLGPSRADGRYVTDFRDFFFGFHSKNTTSILVVRPKVVVGP